MHAVILFDHAGAEAHRISYPERGRAYMAAGMANKDLAMGRARVRLLGPAQGDEPATIDRARIARAVAAEVPEVPESDHQVRAAGEDRR